MTRSSQLDEKSSGLAQAPEPGITALLKIMPSLLRYGRSLTGSAADAEDLVQLALERALSRSEGIDGISNLATWMRCIMRNAWLDMCKSARRRYELSETTSTDHPGVDGEAVLQRRDQVRAVQRALLQLSPDLRQSLLLVSVEGLSYRDAAEKLGVPVATLNSRIARARAQLAEKLGLLDRPAPPNTLIA